MRTRVLLAGLGLAVVSVIGVASPLSAQEPVNSDSEDTSQAGASEARSEEVIHEAEELAEENGSSKFDAECIPILVEGGSVDDCQESPSPILPPLNELVWGAISFAIVVGLLWKLAFPGIKKGMDGRTERIRSDLAAAESARTEAESTRAGYQSQLADARQESARILEEARQQADAVRSERLAAIEPEIQELRTQAQADAEATRTQALSDLRGEVASLALGAAERVVERNLDDETNRALIDSYIDQVGASR